VATHHPPKKLKKTTRIPDIMRDQNKGNKNMTLTTLPDDKQELLKKTICKDIDNNELEMFLHVCSRTCLDPFRNQIYAVKRAGKMTIQTGIDGFRLIAERTGKYSPGREPTYEYDAQSKLVSATSYVKKMTPDGTWHEIAAKAYWNEYVQAYNGKPSNFWAKMPHNQLAKCAEALALRKAFPADMSGIYTTEEMAQADNNEINITPVKEETVKIEEPEMSDLELEGYLSTEWKGRESDVKEWLTELKKKQKWTFRKAIDIIHKTPENLERTKNDIETWKMRKVGI
jgi:phage recombination protein Bet